MRPTTSYERKVELTNDLHSLLILNYIHNPIINQYRYDNTPYYIHRALSDFY